MCWPQTQQVATIWLCPSRSHTQIDCFGLLSSQLIGGKQSSREFKRRQLGHQVQLDQQSRAKAGKLLLLLATDLCSSHCLAGTCVGSLARLLPASYLTLPAQPVRLDDREKAGCTLANVCLSVCVGLFTVCVY